MIVEFNPKVLLNNIPVNPNLKLYYEKNIEAIVNIFSEYIDTSSIERIIVPHNFIDEVLKYQEKIGYKTPSVTNNEYGKAYGKLLLNQHSGKHIVFLDSEIATFLMGDSLTENIIKIAGEENRKTEERIIDEKWKYKTHQISLNDFCNYFHLLTRQTLINMVSIVSVLDKDLSNSAYYENCLIGMIVDIFKTEFDRIYYDIHDDKKFVIPNSLLEAINSYYQAFGVYISEEPRGLYYYIPD